MDSILQQIEENLLSRLPMEGVKITGKLTSYQILSIADKCNFKSVIKECSLLITRECKSYKPPSCKKGYSPETKINVYTDWMTKKLNEMNKIVTKNQSNFSDAEAIIRRNNLPFTDCYHCPYNYIKGIQEAVQSLASAPE
jgi:hypothetical protein